MKTFTSIHYLLFHVSWHNNGAQTLLKAQETRKVQDFMHLHCLNESNVHFQWHMFIFFLFIENMNILSILYETFLKLNRKNTFNQRLIIHFFPLFFQLQEKNISSNFRRTVFPRAFSRFISQSFCYKCMVRA